MRKEQQRKSNFDCSFFVVQHDVNKECQHMPAYARVQGNTNTSQNRMSRWFCPHSQPSVVRTAGAECTILTGISKPCVRACVCACECVFARCDRTNVPGILVTQVAIVFARVRIIRISARWLCECVSSVAACAKPLSKHRSWATQRTHIYPVQPLLYHNTHQGTHRHPQTQTVSLEHGD